jgi:hypothetical protein
VKEIDSLIYDLIFSEKTEFKINVAEYIQDIYRYEDFINEIRLILKKSKVTIHSTQVLITDVSVVWQLKVSK